MNDSPHTARVLAGDPAAEALLNRTKDEATLLARVPHLHVIRIGDDPASISYTRMKARRAKKVGLESTLHELATETSETELLALIEKLNNDPSASGILVQLPFPKGSSINQLRVLESIHPDKDVDGLHRINVGRLWAGEDGLRPCTPSGVITLLDFYAVPIAGKHVVVINRSQLVGKPLAALLLARDATVTLAHSRTTDLPNITRQADIVVTAVGRPNFITAAMLKPGATLIDVSINRVVDETGKEHLVGDAAKDVWQVAGAVTPVPGSVGPMTVAHLLHNTVLAATRQTINQK